MGLPDYLQKGYIPKLVFNDKGDEVSSLKPTKRGLLTYLSRHVTNKSSYKTDKILGHIKKTINDANERANCYAALQKKSLYFSNKKIEKWVKGNDSDAATILFKQDNKAANSSEKDKLSEDAVDTMRLLQTTNFNKPALFSTCSLDFFKEIIEKKKTDEYLNNISGNNNLETTLTSKSLLETIFNTKNPDLINGFLKKVAEKKFTGNSLKILETVVTDSKYLSLYDNLDFSNAINLLFGASAAAARDANLPPVQNQHTPLPAAPHLPSPAKHEKKEESKKADVQSPATKQIVDDDVWKLPIATLKGNPSTKEKLYGFAYTDDFIKAIKLNKSIRDEYLNNISDANLRVTLSSKSILAKIFDTKDTGLINDFLRKVEKKRTEGKIQDSDLKELNIIFEDKENKYPFLYATDESIKLVTPLTVPPKNIVSQSKDNFSPWTIKVILTWLKNKHLNSLELKDVIHKKEFFQTLIVHKKIPDFLNAISTVNLNVILEDEIVLKHIFDTKNQTLIIGFLKLCSDKKIDRSKLEKLQSVIDEISLKPEYDSLKNNKDYPRLLNNLKLEDKKANEENAQLIKSVFSEKQFSRANFSKVRSNLRAMTSKDREVFFNKLFAMGSENVAKHLDERYLESLLNDATAKSLIFADGSVDQKKDRMLGFINLFPKESVVIKNVNWKETIQDILIGESKSSATSFLDSLIKTERSPIKAVALEMQKKLKATTDNKISAQTWLN